MSGILITGGDGFIGSTLAKRLLKQKHEIFVLDKNKEPQERKWYRNAIKYLEKLEASTNVPTQIRQLIMHMTAKLDILVREIWTG